MNETSHSASFGQLSAPKRYLHFKYSSKDRNLQSGSHSLLEYLTEELPQIPEERLSWLIHLGAVYVNSYRILEPQKILEEDDVVRIHLEPKRYSLDFEKLEKRLIFQNQNFIVMNKPSGLPMHPTLDNYHENLLKGLERALETKLYITHRLDVPTSGLVVLAKNSAYQTAFNKLISSRGLEKKYAAHTLNALPPGILHHWMRNTPHAPKEITNVQNVEWDECLLEILNCRKTEQGTYLLNINLLTGRTHQIRAQLSAAGAPIIGDEMYGGVPSDWFGLSAVGLAFTCPISHEYQSFKLS